MLTKMINPVGRKIWPGCCFWSWCEKRTFMALFDLIQLPFQYFCWWWFLPAPEVFLISLVTIFLFGEGVADTAAVRKPFGTSSLFKPAGVLFYSCNFPLATLCLRLARIYSLYLSYFVFILCICCCLGFPRQPSDFLILVFIQFFIPGLLYYMFVFSLYLS